MVYCNLKEQKDNYAIYYTGSKVSDISGEVKFYKEFKNPQIIKQPDSGILYQSMVNRLAVKYKIQFSNGEFPDKISYEI